MPIIKPRPSFGYFITVKFEPFLCIDQLTYPYQKGFENFLVLSMIVIFPLGIPSRVILVVLDICNEAVVERCN